MRITKSTLFSWVKRSLVVMALVAIVATIVWAMRPKPVPVETATIARGPMVVTVDERGRARVMDRHVVVAPLAGTLARIELHAGDEVAAGQLLARIAPLPAPLLDPRTRREAEGRVSIARARVQQAVAAVRRAETAHAYARTERDRVRTLVERDAVPRLELDRRQLELDLATRELESARFGASVADDELATARAMVARLGAPGARPSQDEIAVHAPVAGRVLRVLAESEGVVAPGTPLVEVGDPARLEIVIDVLTADAVEIQPGAPVEIRGWGGAPLPAIVRRVEPSATTRVSALGVEEQRVAVVVDLVGSPGERRGLGDGWRVEGRIVVWSAPEVTTVPLSALFRDGQAWAVYVVEGGVARRRTVTIGKRNAVVAEVREGLAPGERVIFHPGDRISDGARVAVD